MVNNISPSRAAAIRQEPLFQDEEGGEHELACTAPAGQASVEGAFAIQSDGSIINWNGAVRFTQPVDGIHHPASIRELASLIRDASKVRLVGAGHSMNASLAAEGSATLIQTTRLKQIDPVVASADGAGTVWIDAGATLGDIAAALNRQGYALECMPSSEKITIGGAINGVHGSSLKHPATLSEQVTGMEMITSNGDQVRVPQELLPLTRSHLGSLGAVARVQLRCVPMFRLQSTDQVVPLQTALDPKNVRAAMRRHDYSRSYLYNPSAGTVLCRYLDVIKDVPSGVKEKRHYEAGAGSTPGWVFRLAAKLPGVLGKGFDWLMRTVGFRKQESRYGAAHVMFHEDWNHPAHDMSYGVPLDNALSAVQELTKAFDRIGYSLHVPISIRFLGATDKASLMMNSGQDTAVIEFASIMEYDANPKKLALRVAAQAEFERVMRAYGGRPHWQKEFSVRPQDQYPAQDWQAFTELSRTWGRKMSNSWARKFTPAGEGA